MGWFACVNGAVIGDPAADYLETLIETAGGKLPWRCACEIPNDVRSALDTLYLEGIGRKPTNEDLQALLEFVRQ